MEIYSNRTSRRIELTSDIDRSTERIHRCKKLLFDDIGAFHVRLIRLSKSLSCANIVNLMIAAQQKWEITLLNDEKDLEDHLVQIETDKFRIISFFQEFSLAPLMCSETAMLKTIEKFEISAMFVDVLVKFGDQPQVFQESSGFRQLCQALDGSFELCYQLMYIEPNGRRRPRNPWSIRQTGAYHRYNALTKQNCIVLLHPNDEAEAQARVESLARSQVQLEEHPLNLHLVIISSYMAHWQDHTEDLASELEQIGGHIVRMNITKPDALSAFTPDRLQTLRYIEDKIMCRAHRCLQSTLSLVKTLVDINKTLASSRNTSTKGCEAVRQELQLLEHRLQGHTNAIETLGQRVRIALGLFTDLVNIRNQTNSKQISARILRLTQESVDDNATVKVITICTLIYLPASFMASFLGMNLFEFKESDGYLRASPQFWIFVVTTFPLTMLTVGTWYFYTTRASNKRKALNAALGAEEV